MESPEPKTNPQDDTPPFFRSWNQMYLFVIVLHAIIITMFYIFTQTYS